VSTRPQPALRRMKPLLGTFVEIGVFEPDAAAPGAIAAAFAEIAAFGRAASFQDPASELSRLNQSTGRIALGARLLRALRLARAMTLASGGLYDCTRGGELVARGRLPDHGGAALAAGVADDLELFAGGARLRRPVRITLDGLAKGLAVDAGIAVLRRHGARHAWINAGGDVRVTGRHALPVELRATGDVLLLREAALASSAGPERWDASRPGEIVGANGPAHGRWSVLAARAWRADALTKVAALAPITARDALLAKLGGRLVDAAARAHAA
jgi:FAD:protein FMN transferase